MAIECPVCMRAIIDGHASVGLQQCGHVMCTKCFDLLPTVSLVKRCPVCRSPVKSSLKLFMSTTMETNQITNNDIQTHPAYILQQTKYTKAKSLLTKYKQQCKKVQSELDATQTALGATQTALGSTQTALTDTQTALDAALTALTDPQTQLAKVKSRPSFTAQAPNSTPMSDQNR